MRTLFLLRHAKSSWADPALADHDRPLAPRGTRAAARVAAHLRRRDIRPDLVLCSTARRAHDTLEALRPALGGRAAIHLEPGLYTADAAVILDRLRAVDPHAASVMVIGHNPALADLATVLARDGDDAALSRLRTKFPTGALATLDVEASWDRLGPGGAYLARVVVPRELPR